MYGVPTCRVKSLSAFIVAINGENTCPDYSVTVALSGMFNKNVK